MTYLYSARLNSIISTSLKRPKETHRETPISLARKFLLNWY